MVPLNIALAGLETWFKERPAWLQDAARRTLQNGSIGNADIEELVALCKAEGGFRDLQHPDLKPRGITKEVLGSTQNSSALHLDAVHSPKGINALNPQSPLELGAERLTIIYGQNGSGKTGYVRALKHACGSRRAGQLYANIFAKVEPLASCELKYSVDGIARSSVWQLKDGPLAALRSVQIYDTQSAELYVNEENEVVHEPFVLRLFTLLTNICQLVSAKIEAEIGAKTSKLARVPWEISGTQSANWHDRLTHNTKDSEVEEFCAWTDALASELTETNRRLAEDNPAQKAKFLRKLRERQFAFYTDLQKIAEGLSEANSAEYIRLREEAKSKRRAADVDASKIFSGGLLEGIGTESWKLMWEQARAYSEKEAYKGDQFPFTEAGARCVLCQQVLEEDTQGRLKSFEYFVRGELETQATQAEERVRAFFANLKSVEKSQLLLLMDSTGITDEVQRKSIISFCSDLEARKQSLLTSQTIDELRALPLADSIEFMDKNLSQLGNDVNKLEGDSKSENRQALSLRQKELEAQKWVAGQSISIQGELRRLREIKLLEKARALANTQVLSLKKSQLAEDLITNSYVARFQKQLNDLRAQHLQVQLIKTRAEKGRVYHRILLRNARQSAPVSSILSEGEFRIVSLAAFLADVESQEGSDPLVFDDPISSLDQIFEEAVVAKLVEIVNSRQVIVFTHRISLMVQLEDAAKRAGIKHKTVALRAESWGVGEPYNPVQGKPATILSKLEGRVEEAAGLGKNSAEQYERLAKGICSDFRILLESMIESNLISDVVQRFRRNIITKNRIMKLAKIDSTDCKLFDDLMTEYSKYEHSQPFEAPVSLPEPAKLKKDIGELRKWLIEFDKR